MCVQRVYHQLHTIHVILDARLVVHYVQEVIPVHVVETHIPQDHGGVGPPPPDVMVQPSYHCLVHLLLTEHSHVLQAGDPCHNVGKVQAKELLASHDVQEVALDKLEGGVDELRAHVVLGKQPRLDAVRLVQLGLEELEARAFDAIELEEVRGREEGVDVVVHQPDARRVREIDQSRELVLAHLVDVYRLTIGLRELADEHGLEVGATCGQDHLVGTYLHVIGDQGDVA